MSADSASIQISPGVFSIAVSYTHNGQTFTTSLPLNMASEYYAITPPTKTAYSVGETFDYTGLSVVRHSSDGTSADVTANCTLSPAAGTAVTQVGDITVSVIYEQEEVGAFHVEGGIIAQGDWWTLYSDGLLYIYCVGDMSALEPDNDEVEFYPTSPPMPWDSYDNAIKSVVIADSVTDIDYSAFAYCNNLESVTIGNGVTEIKDNAFDSCASLKSVTFGNSLETIGEQAFYGCGSLTEIEFPDSVTYIGGMSFEQCGSLESVTFGNGVTLIGGRAFQYCSSLTSIVIPDSVTTLGGEAFDGCENLVSVTIGDGVETIHRDTFYGCNNISYFKLGNGVKTLLDAAFDNCGGSATLIIPNSVTNIEAYPKTQNTTFADHGAFSGCSFDGIKIANGRTYIPYGAFCYCGMKYIVIPASVTQINYAAFFYCNSLTDVYYAGTQAQWNAIEIKHGMYNNTTNTGNNVLRNGNATIHYNSSGPT